MKKISDLIEKREDHLKERFLEQLNNETFRSIVDKLKIDQKELYKYTSSIENSACEVENCMKCNCLSECKNEVSGYCNLPEVDGEGITFSYKACRYKKKDIEKNKYKENLNLFDVPTVLKEAKIKDIYTDDDSRTEAIKYILNYIENYKDKDLKGLYLHGNFGTGKTYLIASLFNELAKKGEKSAIIYFPEFLRSLKASFKNSDPEEATFSDKYEYIKRIPYLLIDDIGAENVTAWGRDEILGTLLQYRANENLPTFFTSNLNIEELENNLAVTKDKSDKVKARRIIERVKLLTNDIEIIGKNRR
ncbi:MAG: primosomal protein DnaI [Bacilli bacterium]|nr:primosomal protein DnaI [Bacilli bacterium]